jgi:hypothetical protein
MNDAKCAPDIRIELQLRTTSSSEVPVAEILRTLRIAGGDLYAHLAYHLGAHSVGLFLCEKPAEGAEAMTRGGFKVETESVLTVRARNRPGVLSFLIQTLEAEAIEVGYSYSVSTGEDFLAVFRTIDNPKAEDVLRRYLILADPFRSQPPEPPT